MPRTPKSRISAKVIFWGRSGMPERLHRIIGSRHDLELGNGPWRALAHRRIVDAVAGMNVVQRHPLLRLEFLRRVGRRQCRLLALANSLGVFFVEALGG
jgi:hypothetical protein